ncbi:hypothetical protein JOF29_002629 [Kribbella aluminosa]|uniref:SRPBCC family protein n=1 Tax=Kribbella aluminosa TaxID=416017 RepID=A0ABS4UIQ3_9ACTN|nr:hypothetical protein [Kribbella aluminosa]MBP2351546.1 hypothetical protein [Kribbella aluminosa]
MAQQKVYCASAASDVYRAVSTVLGRERFWADQAPESDGVISFVLADGRRGQSRIERAVQDQLYELRYFGRTLTFRLAPAAAGTDLTLTSDGPDDVPELVSLLLRLKASVDFGVDLRNHDANRSTHYADS